jgi:hypothetical protein
VSFQTTALKYGWAILTALGLGTGATIYVLNSTRPQIEPQDFVEVILGIYERCLATQTATNPLTYGVAPLDLVETWVNTNMVEEIVTNTIGWFPPKRYMVKQFPYVQAFDETLKALIPFFVNTNTIYNGATSDVAMLTVTGLWAELKIGDGTNLFTRTPCWTNTVTNWIVCYTSYWPSTNGAATKICYTSTYQQAANYAESWTATGGHVWVTSSNWVSTIVTSTNAATYGDWNLAGTTSNRPWQIYRIHLQERYKVLNALKATRSNIAAGGFYGPSVTWEDSWEVAKSYAEIYFQVEWGKGFYGCFTQGEKFLNTNWWFALVSSIQITSPDVSSFSTSVSFNARSFIKPDLPFSFPRGYSPTNLEYAHFDDNGLGVALNTWYEIPNLPFGLSFGPPKEVPGWCPNPEISPVIVFSAWGDKIQLITKGFTIPAEGQVLLVDWNFSYCTNKYW